MISAENPRFFAYRPAAWLRVTGEDAGAYLQGQFTQDLRGLQGPRAAYGLWLTPKGKILADSFVLASAVPGEFWVGSYFSPGASIRLRLEQNIVADDVEVNDETEHWHGVAVLGSGSGDWLRAGLPSGAVSFPGRRAARENWECLWPESAAARMRERLNAVPLGTGDELERERIMAAIPAVPRDAGPGELPPEAGLQDQAISYTKGCYLGQEIIARLKARGRVRRSLRRVRGYGVIPALPAALWAEGRKVGELRSAAPADAPAEFVGLALAAFDLPAEAAASVSESGGAEPTQVRFCV